MNKLKHLNERDVRILKALDDYGLMSTSQIKTGFFKDTSKRTMLKRLQILSLKNFIRFTEGLPRGERVWCLTKSSSLMLGSETLIKGINKNTLYHDVKLNDLRQKIEPLGISSHWKNGHYLKQKASEDEGSFVPDSFFLLKTKNALQTVALELELSKKAKSRYINTFGKYFDKPEILWLWYIVPTKKFGEHLLRMQPQRERERGFGKFRWSLLDEVLNSPKTAGIYSVKGRTTLSEVCDFKSAEHSGQSAPHPVYELSEMEKFKNSLST